MRQKYAKLTNEPLKYLIIVMSLIEVLPTLTSPPYMKSWVHINEIYTSILSEAKYSLVKQNILTQVLINFVILLTSFSVEIAFGVDNMHRLVLNLR